MTGNTRAYYDNFIVQESVEIEIEGFEFDYARDGNVEHLLQHDVSPDDVYAVLAGVPRFFLNLAGRGGSHVMVGWDDKGRALYISLAVTQTRGIWRPITGWESRSARRFLREASKNE